MTISQSVARHRFGTPDLPDSPTALEPGDSTRQSGKQWRYTSAIEAARALNELMNKH